MSICPYNKSIKTSTPTTPTSNTSKKLKDERPHANFPTRGNSKKPSHDTRKGQPSQRNFGGRGQQQRSLSHRKDQRLETYAPGNSYVKPDGSVKESAKKVSLNHLLNFKFEARETEDFSHLARSKCKRGYKRNGSAPAFKKERFLQANCKFIVSNYGDYSIHFTDPDAPVPWDRVEQVKIFVDDEVFCPICLYPPSVPKVTKCGHVFCWSCILHYLALDDDKRHTRGCPICNVSVHKSNLRSVSIHERIPLSAGNEVEMKLMIRSSTSLIPHPILEIDSSQRFDSERISENAKITTFSSHQILDEIIKPELVTLKLKLEEQLEDLEREFVNSAIRECEERKKQISNDISNELNNNGASIAVKTSVSDSDSNSFSASGLDIPNLNTTLQKELPARGSSKDVWYYFYQSEDGENAYLDGINVKCFLKEYGSFAKCPPVIKAKLVHSDSFVMTEDLRKRHKYLSHLPLSCEYKIVELDLKPPLISQETLDEFKGQIQRRAKTRKNKERQENDSRKRAEYEERQKMKLQYFQNHSYSVTSSAFAPNSKSSGSFSVLVDEAGTSAIPVAAVADRGSVSATSSEYSISPTSFPYSSSAPMSFAQMLRTGETVASKPLQKRSQEISNNATGLETIPKAPLDDDNDVEDPYYMAPTFKSSFGDALSAALDGLDMSPSCANAGTDKAMATKGGKKRRKKKQTLLFSTSVQMHQ